MKGTGNQQQINKLLSTNPHNGFYLSYNQHKKHFPDTNCPFHDKSPLTCSNRFHRKWFDQLLGKPLRRDLFPKTPERSGLSYKCRCPLSKDSAGLGYHAIRKTTYKSHRDACLRFLVAADQRNYGGSG